MEENKKSTEDKLSSCIDFIKKEYSITLKSNVKLNFPRSKVKQEDSLKILVEQAENLLQNKSFFNEIYNTFGAKDRNDLIEMFYKDLNQFATEHEIKISDEYSLYFTQNTITAHAFFHRATMSLLPESYRDIDTASLSNVFDIYAIPFKIRISLENKIKSMVGFNYCNITRGRKIIKRSEDFPFTLVLHELIQLKCLDIPCRLECLLNVYKWSCSFCHTGRKEYVWMSMKGLELLSSLFLYNYQKEKELSISDVWKINGEEEDFNSERFFSYNGFHNPLYYLSDNWTIERLQKALNTSKNKSLSAYEFNLSTKAFSEHEKFYHKPSGDWI